MGTWQVQEAKTRLSEVIERARISWNRAPTRQSFGSKKDAALSIVLDRNHDRALRAMTGNRLGSLGSRPAKRDHELPCSNRPICSAWFSRE
jgi:hypothetical protein